MHASVVVLPEPVGPVTRNTPRGRRQIDSAIRGSPICWKVMMLFGIRRSTRLATPFCLKIETRKRACSPYAKPKSPDPVSSNSCWMRSGVIDFINAIVSSASSTFVCNSRMCPLRRSVGGLPTARCKSDAFFLTTVSSRRSIWIVEAMEGYFRIPVIANAGCRVLSSARVIPTNRRSEIGSWHFLLVRNYAFHLRHLHDLLGGGDAVEDFHAAVVQQALHP